MEVIEEEEEEELVKYEDFPLRWVNGRVLEFVIAFPALSDERSEDSRRTSHGDFFTRLI